MGCDIHMYAEVKMRDGWQAVGRVFKSEYYSTDKPSLVYANDDRNNVVEESNSPHSIHPYNGRNYHLFAVLADVRNSWGICPMTNPRGIPGDVSRFVKNESDEYDIDGHSHSWLTLTELKSYPWGKPFTDSGVVKIDRYRKFRDDGEPPNWYCGGVSGPKVVMVTNAEMDKVLDGEGIEGMQYYTQIQWEWTMAETCSDFLTVTIPALEALLGKKGVDDVRIVFLFDN